MPQVTIDMEVVLQIGCQLRNGNAPKTVLSLRHSEDLTSIAPDIAFTPSDIYLNLTAQQLWTFQEQPFTPYSLLKLGRPQAIQISKTK
ncbi:1475_t:CDS:2 [Ambispora gerdemannii]|uniref:1475_t:CDS:1 n=1 Tax=Ambispora gerdemannii TaxID=144530 RepID=A0A9N9E9Q5_9GLOM|nr:1475_t:CDS:2 [Ambispora gerdemannii]